MVASMAMKLLLCARAVPALRAGKQDAEVQEARPINRDFCPQPPGASLRPREQGRVDWLYTFGAPGVSKIPLQHATTRDGVFPGIRTWRGENDTYLRWTVDIVPVAARLAGMVHPLIVAEEIKSGEMPVRFPVDDNVAKLPKPSSETAVSLHDPGQYARIVDEAGCPTWSALSTIGNEISYAQTVSEARQMAAKVGWQVIGDGANKDEDIFITQRSYLLQNPETLECVVTFEGTSNPSDWLANLKFFPVSFCGYGSVHSGFVKQLRDIVRHESWQLGVRTNLGRCSAVYATGHSLGGALASLFTACMSKMKFQHTPGYEDLGYLSWRRKA